MQNKKLLSSLLAISLIAPNFILPTAYASNASYNVIIQNLEAEKHNKVNTNNDSTVITSALGGLLGGISISSSVKLTPSVNSVGDRVYMCAVSPDDPEIDGRATIVCHADFATINYTGEKCLAQLNVKSSGNPSVENDEYDIDENIRSKVKIYPLNTQQNLKYAQNLKPCNSSTPMKLNNKKDGKNYYYVKHYSASAYCQGDSSGKTYGSGNICTTTIDSLSGGEVSISQLFTIQRRVTDETGETRSYPSQILNPIITLDVYSGTTSMGNNNTDTYSYAVDLEGGSTPINDYSYPNWSVLDDGDFTGGGNTNNGNNLPTNNNPTNTTPENNSKCVDGIGVDCDFPNNSGSGTGGTQECIDINCDITGGSTDTIPTANGSNDSSSFENAVQSLLGDSIDSFGAGDNDWASSNGGSNGLDDLDDYFGGINSDLSDIPGGLTEDLLGVAGMEDEYNQDADMLDGNPADENTYSDNVATNNYNQDSYADNNDDDTVFSNFGLPISNLGEQYASGLAGLDGLTGDNNGLLGMIEGTGSLADKLNSLINGDKSVMNNKNVTASNQELFDIAKKLLLASGFSLDDLKKGKNYDANSAYTEPVVAWDMNRITTLLKGKKINLNDNKSANKTNNQKNSKTNKK